MSPFKRWTPGAVFEPGAPRPAPAGGIRVKRAGSTWWGQRWFAALEDVLGIDARRLARGRGYARSGRVHDLVLSGGRVTARVAGSRPEPYEVTLALGVHDDVTWQRVVLALAQRAHYAAELLAGRMPEDVEDVFRDTGASLFPSARNELETSCSCPDAAVPCKHVAATHAVLAEALDRDPFLLFELRGRPKPRLLAELAAARAGDRARSAAGHGAPAAQGVELGELASAAYDRAEPPPPALVFHFEPPEASGALLKQLGAPASWPAHESPADLLLPAVRAAAALARQLALAAESAGDEPDTPEPQG